MGKLRTFSNAQALFVGPSPSTGFHFIDNLGNLNDNYSGLNSTNNLVHEIDRVNNISYQVNFDRVELKHLGKRGLVARPVINSPTISLNFDYLQNGLKNEARLGLNVNYNRYEYPFLGAPFYSGYTCPISGFTTRSFAQPSSQPYWPLDYRDDRNFFIVIDKNNESIHDQYYNVENFNTPDNFIRANLNNGNFYVASFGNCRMISYKTQAAVNSFPKCSVSYVAENFEVISGGSGQFTPAVCSKNFSGVNKHFVIPESVNEGGPSVIVPGDITVDISKNFLIIGSVTGLLTGYYSGLATGAPFLGNIFLTTGFLVGNFMGQVSGGFNTGTVVIPVNQPSVINENVINTLTQINTGIYSGLYSGAYKGAPNNKFSWTYLDTTLSVSYLNLDTGFLTGWSFVSGNITGFHSGIVTGIVSGNRNYFADNLGIDATDLKIQSYSIDMSLNRESLQSLGYVLPVDRKINFPVYANLSINAIVGNDYSGSLFNQLDVDDDYNICIKLRNPACSVDFNESTIPPAQEFKNQASQTAIRYDFLKAKFLSSSFQTNINQSRVGTFNFSAEIDPDDLNHGLFISGLLNIAKVEDYLIDSSGNYIIDNSGELVISNYAVLY